MQPITGDQRMMKEKLFFELVEDCFTSSAKALLARNSRYGDEALQKASEVEALGKEMCGESAGRFSGFHRDLELFWEHTRFIAETALRINEEPQLKAYEDLPLLIQHTHEMIRAAFQSVLNGTGLDADSLRERRRLVSEIDERLAKDIQALMKKTPNNVNRGVNLILVSGRLVQIAELAVSVCSASRI